MKRRKLPFANLLFIGLLLFLSGCAVNPVTGEQELMLLSEQEESRLGLETDRSILHQYGLYDDAELQGYMQDIGARMGRGSHRPALEWQFKVIDSPVVNAFAAPGGYIYVTRGLLAAVNNEAELAGVIGHEIGHVTARHSAQQYSNELLAQIGLGLGQSLLGDYEDVLGPVLEAGAGLLFLKFSRDDEREADALGVEYATRSGYDAAKMADFFTTLQRQSATDGDSASRLPEFFSTHPNPANRESSVRKMAQSWQTRFPQQSFAVERNAFLQKIDGLVYGQDPRLGFQEGDWYYLPRYRVKFPLLPDWSLEREGNNIQMTHPQQRAVTIFSIRSDSRIRDAVGSFLEATGATIRKQQDFVTRGMETRLMASIIDDGSERAIVMSRFYQSGADVFAFHSMTSEADIRVLSNPMQRPAVAFGPITEQAFLDRQPQRIRVKKVARTALLQEALRRLQVDSALWPEIAWLNGLALDAQVQAGQHLKVITE